MKEVQEIVKEFIKKNNLETTPESRTLDIMSELGEVSKEILKSNDYGKQSAVKSDELTQEMGDLLFSLVCLANQFDINLDEALKIVLEKYKKRLTKGSPGSENE